MGGGFGGFSGGMSFGQIGPIDLGAPVVIHRNYQHLMKVEARNSAKIGISGLKGRIYYKNNLLEERISDQHGRIELRATIQDDSAAVLSVKLFQEEKEISSQDRNPTGNSMQEVVFNLLRVT